MRKPTTREQLVAQKIQLAQGLHNKFNRSSLASGLKTARGSKNNYSNQAQGKGGNN